MRKKGSLFPSLAEQDLPVLKGRGVRPRLEQRKLAGQNKDEKKDAKKTKLITNTQVIKRTLFNWKIQDKTCKFLRKSSFFSFFVQATYNIKTGEKMITSTYLVSVKHQT